MNKIGLVIIAPKRIAASEYTNVLNETKNIIKLLNYYHGDTVLKEIEALSITPVGANAYINNYLKSAFKIPIKVLSMSIYDPDITFLDLVRNHKYEHTYVFCLWDGVDEVVKQQILSANKFGYQPRMKMIKRWNVGDRTFV